MESDLGIRGYLNTTEEGHWQSRQRTEGKRGKLVWEGNERV